MAEGAKPNACFQFLQRHADDLQFSRVEEGKKYQAMEN